VTGSAGVGDDTLEFVDLGLGTTEGTESLLCEFTGTLVFAVSEQFNDTLLVWCKTSNLLHDITNERSALRQMTLGPRDSRLGNTSFGFVAFVGTDGKTGAFCCHLDCW